MEKRLLYYQKYIQGMPIFLLTLGCGVDSGTLMTISVVFYLINCRLYHESVIGPIMRSKLLWYSIFAMLFWLLCLWIPMYWTGGEYGRLWKYAGRTLPLLLVCLLARDKEHTFWMIWLGFLTALGWQEFDTALHPRFSLDHRLMGSFNWFNSLAIAIVVLCPMILVGIVKYGRHYKKLAITASILYGGGLGVILLTGSRNAYIVSVMLIALIFIFLFRLKDKLFLKIGSIVIVLGVILGVILAPSQMIQNRLHKPIGQDGRVWLIQVGLDIYDKYPNTGIGLGNWGKVYHAHYELPGKEKNMGSPHNIYLQTLNESGRIGLLGFLAMFAFQMRTLVKNGFIMKRSGECQLRWTVASFLLLISILVSGMMDYDFFSRNIMHLFWFYWGIAVCDIYYTQQHLLKNHERVD